MTRNIKLTICYDGGRYHGWQSQKHTTGTIQQKIEELLTKYLQEPIRVYGSGRTDAGVHALAQVANFHTTKDCSLKELQQAFFDYLPQDIAVTSIEEVEPRFHARLTAVGKCYRYRIWNSPLLDVFQRGLVWQISEPLDVHAMREAAALLCGTHDFISFCSLKKRKKSSVRTISDISIAVHEVPFGKEIIMDFTGDGFLYNMVRILTGTLVEVGQHKLLPSHMPAILEAKNRQSAGMTAPPMGLMLMRVDYPD